MEPTSRLMTPIETGSCRQSAPTSPERISREEFARRTRLRKSTVDKLVVEIFSEKTILQTEAQAKISLLSGGGPAVEAAAEEFGRYIRDDTKNYLGEYVFARPSFQDDGLIHAFHMEIVWDRDVSVLLVRKVAAGKNLPLQFGTVYIPQSTRPRGRPLVFAGRHEQSLEN